MRLRRMYGSLRWCQWVFAVLMKWKWKSRLIFYVFTFHFFGLLVPFCGLEKLAFSPRYAAKCKDRHGGSALTHIAHL